MPFHGPEPQDSNSFWQTVEVWADTSRLQSPYILVLIQDSSGSWRILDPAEDYRVVFSSQSYEETKLWLLEDEYELVNGRMTREM